MGGVRAHVLEQALAGAEGSACELPDGYWGNPEATAEALRGGWLHREMSALWMMRAV